MCARCAKLATPPPAQDTTAGTWQQGMMVYVKPLNSLIKPWHTVAIYHPSQLSLPGAMPYLNLTLFFFFLGILTVTIMAMKILKVYYFYDYKPMNRSHLCH